MNIVVTGASGGIGRECVKQLAGMQNVNVYAVSRSESGLLNLKEECHIEFDKTIKIKSIDFLQSGFQNTLKDWLDSELSHIDGLVNNAGMLINKEFSKVNRTDIENQFRINFEAPLLIIQSLIHLMSQSKTGAHVVNIGSMGGFQGSTKFPGLSVYSASKGALATLTECLAYEYASSKISFNCLALGSADTEMLRKAFPDYKSPMSPKSMAKFISDFLMTGHKYFNGKVIPVSGLNT